MFGSLWSSPLASSEFSSGSSLTLPKDFQFPLGRVKEEPEENSEEARGELQSDPNISGKSLGGQGKAGFLGEGEDGRVSGDGWPGEPRTPTPQAVWPSGC
uniref:Uncharacterized protein n=1 Tax=Micrurus lemniscatus lemniscatus TaxID=129467 RepID=A0A2D4HXQ9_MICLE